MPKTEELSCARPQNESDHPWFLAHDHRLKRAEARLGEIESKVDILSDCVARLTALQERTDEKIIENQREIDKQEREIDKIKDRRGEIFDKTMGYLVSALIGGVVVFILSQIGLR